MILDDPSGRGRPGTGRAPLPEAGPEAGGAPPEPVLQRTTRKPAEVIPGLFHYGVREPRSWVSDDACIVDDGAEVVLIDPLPVETTLPGPPRFTRAIIISPPGHQRSSWTLGRHAGAPVLAPAGGAGLDRTDFDPFHGGGRLPGGILAIEAPGPVESHFLLYIPLGPGVVYCPDLLINHPTQGLRFVPDDFQVSPYQSRRSARRLLGLKFDVMCFGHGLPIVSGAREALEACLEQDAKNPRTSRSI
jgi:hypothetical protein